MPKRMKYPNGYGSVYKLSGRRRNPWIVRITVGRDEEGKQIRKSIGYYPTFADANEALVAYNRDPSILESNMTFSECYQRVLDGKSEKLSTSAINGYKASYKLCGSIEKMRMRDIRLIHLENIVATCGKNHATLVKFKSMLHQVFDWAVKHEVIPPDKNFVSYLDISMTTEEKISAAQNKKHVPFTTEEIAELWKLSDDQDVQTILMLIYSGVRIGELLNLKPEDVNLDEKWFDVKQSKTAAGIRRVPIADKVLPFFSARYGSGFDVTYHKYLDYYWTPVMERMGMKHFPHDTRHTCASLLNTAEVNPTTVKMILGHAGQMDLTERVYTHKVIGELITAINRI